MGLKKFFKGFHYAFKGMNYAFNTQINFKVHLGMAVVTTLLGYYLKISGNEWLWILTAVSLVLVVELINTAVETLVDLVSPEYHPKAGIVKDVSAAAVLFTALFAIAVGLLIFVPKIID